MLANGKFWGLSLKLWRFTLQTLTDEILAWVPEDNWAMDVDKLLNNNAECLTPSKKTKLKERKEELTTFQTEYLLSTRREVAFFLKVLIKRKLVRFC